MLFPVLILKWIMNNNLHFVLNKVKTVQSSFQEGLKSWAHQVESGVCLIDGKKLRDDSELTGGQVGQRLPAHLKLCSRALWQLLLNL